MNAKKKNNHSREDRTEKILQMIVQFTQGHFDQRETISDEGDELDAIIIGLNTLGEELQASGTVIRDYNIRVQQIMDTMLRYTLGDFSKPIPLGDIGDELDAIIIGLNTMADEIVSAREEEQLQLQRITEANDFLDTILENIPNMVFVKEAEELRFVRFNKAGEELLGYDREKLIGKNDYDFFPKEQADFFTAKDREALSHNTVTDIPEEEIETTLGKRWLHTKKIPICDAVGNPIYLLGISEDITSKKADDEKIKSLNADLQDYVSLLETANGELEAFTYSVSHDLRAPLRAIHGYTRILETTYMNEVGEDAKKMMASVMRNAQKMGELIDDLLMLSRLGKKELVKKQVDLTDIANQALREVSSSMDASKAQVTIDDLGSVVADSSLMFQVLMNLISNAVKYSSTKEKPIIRVGKEKGSTKGETIYYVKDNGSGFDMKYYDKLFGVFQRLHSMEEFEGTGVGLAIVKRIVTRHGGKVWAEGRVNEGATFYISLKTH